MNQNIFKINGLYTAKCARCNALVKFQKYKSHLSLTCSQKCAASISWAKRQKAEMTTLQCQHCGQDFSLLNSVIRARKKTHGNPMYCSKKCADEAKKNINHCKVCNKVFSGRVARITCGIKCANIFKKRNGTWYENGYIVEYTGAKNGIKQHRRIMQDYLGRKLTNDEVVHHINGIRDDNRLENLQLTTHSEHSSHHRIEEYNRGLLPFRKSNAD